MDVNERRFYSAFPADEEGQYQSTGEGQLIYGPYKSLSAGGYNITFTWEGDQIDGNAALGYVDVCSGQGATVYAKAEMIASENEVALSGAEIPEDASDVE